MSGTPKILQLPLLGLFWLYNSHVGYLNVFSFRILSSVYAKVLKNSNLDYLPKFT